MALDLVISDSHDITLKLVPLFIEEYDLIMDGINEIDDFEITKRVLLDYYGESEIYLSELEDWKKEVLSLIALFESNDTKEELNIYLRSLLEAVDFALTHQRTIKFIGD